MKFIFFNPHKSAFFGITLLNFVSRIHSTTRYKYLIDYFKTNHQHLYLFVTPSSSSLPEYISRYVPIKFEIFLWAIINKINPFKIRLIKNFNQITKKDIFFSLTLRTFDNNSPPSIPSTSQFLKVFHITHFNNFTSVLAKNLKKINPDILVAENNLYKNVLYFKKHFDFYRKNVYTLPYVYEHRFNSHLPYGQRLNKCLATGSLVNIKNLNDSGQFKDFEDYYHLDSLTPFRKTIYENKSKIKKYIDSSISPVFEHKPKYSSQKDSFLTKLVNSLYNGISLSKHKYFKFDIVEKYNQYKMFIIPEEIGLPSVGFVEGMACGCAYVGKTDPMYTDLGLKPNVHYVGYDGSLKNLLAKIAYYQNHPKKLEKIAHAGHKFVTQKFNGSIVAKTFYKDIRSLSKTKKNNG
ncbi:glycosyltransferase [Patescibacteria group bacterium]|nr:glycosyltransferase [Patescibacteria group bacterium]